MMMMMTTALQSMSVHWTLAINAFDRMNRYGLFIKLMVRNLPNKPTETVV